MHDNRKTARGAALLRFALLALAVLLFTLAVALIFFRVPDDKNGQNGGQNSGGGMSPTRPTVIYLDPGHGDFDFGATATLPDGSRIKEKDLVLSLALDTAKALRARGYTVLLSREDDRRHTYTTSAAELYARRADAEEKGATLLLSLHANAYAGEGRAYGARVYYDPADPTAARAAILFAAAVIEKTAPRALRECRIVPDGSYAILGVRDATALLFECGFLSDPAECALLADPDYRARIVDAIALAVERITAGK